MLRTRADPSVVLLSKAEAVVAAVATKVIALKMIARTHSPVILIPTLLPDLRVVPPELTWCLLGGCPLVKDTEVTPEDLPLLHVVEWPTNTHPNKVINNPLPITINITRAVNTTMGIKEAATARTIIAEAEAAAVIVEEEAVEITKAKVEVEVDMVATKSRHDLASSFSL